jgi:hypothetical protein
LLRSSSCSSCSSPNSHLLSHILLTSGIGYFDLSLASSIPSRSQTILVCCSRRDLVSCNSSTTRSIWGTRALDPPHHHHYTRFAKRLGAMNPDSQLMLAEIQKLLRTRQVPSTRCFADQHDILEKCLSVGISYIHWRIPQAHRIYCCITLSRSMSRYRYLFFPKGNRE